MLAIAFKTRQFSAILGRTSALIPLKASVKPSKLPRKVMSGSLMMAKAQQTAETAQLFRFRSYASPPSVKVMKKSELESIIKGDPDSYTLIDVREPGELQYGVIPTSHNIPLGNIPAEFAKSFDDFESTWGFPKPAATDKIIFYCKAGARSASAASYLVQQGYRDVHNYPGFMDWFDRSY